MEQEKKKKKARFFEIYILRVLKKLSPESGITSNARQQLNSFICTVAKKLSENATKLTIITEKKTISEKEVESATKLLFSGELLDSILKYSNGVVERFVDDEGKCSSRQKRAGIIFPPSQAEKFLRNFGHTKLLLSANAPVYCASVLEYLAEKILSLSTINTKKSNRVRITIRDLELVIRAVSDLNSIFISLSFSFLGGGVVPHIHDILLIKKQRKKKKKNVFVKKSRRFLPGTVSIRKIRKFQKLSNCLTLAKLPFERLVRDIINTYNKDIKVSKNLFIVLQYYIEQFIVEFLMDANSVAIHSGRVKLTPSDINFICTLRKYDKLDVSQFIIEEENDEKEDNDEA